MFNVLNKFLSYSVLQQVHRLFQSLFHKNCHLVLPSSISSKLSSLFPTLIQWLLTSSSSSYTFFYISFYLSSNNVFQKAVPTQAVTNPVSLPSSYCLQHIPLLLDYMQYFIFHKISPTDFLHPSDLFFRSAQVSGPYKAALQI
jgi:hypothetical protein